MKKVRDMELSDAGRQVLETELEACKQNEKFLQRQVDDTRKELKDLEGQLRECQRMSEGISRDLGRMTKRRENQ
jgi:septal ring factor EnvC (AmiA/AmiB activator)